MFGLFCVEESVANIGRGLNWDSNMFYQYAHNGLGQYAKKYILK